MATIVSVMYPAREGARFDMEYYLRSHMPLVQERWGPMGLQRWEVLKGGGLAGSKPTYLVIANLAFANAGAFEEAAARHGPEVLGDVPNFTDIEPVIQVSEVVA